VIVKVLGQNVADQRDLLVIPAAGTDAGGLAQRRTCTVGGDREPGFNDAGRAIDLALQLLHVLLQSHRADFGGRQNGDRRLLTQTTPQRRTHHAIHNDEAERVEALLLRVDASKAKAPLIGNVDAPDRCGLAFHQRPNPELFENASTAVRQCSTAVIEARLLGGTEGSRLDQRDRKSQLRQCERETRADQTAARDGDIDTQRLSVALGVVDCTDSTHAFISFSMSSACLASAPVSTSLPSLVTATSSSMRTPIFHQRLWTPLLPAGM
jgi:hypothetical protein